MTTSGHTIALDEEARISALRILDVIANNVVQFELEFERQARSNVQVIDYLGEYLRASGGKRVRPALTILANYAVGGGGSRLPSLRMATVMEFLRSAMTTSSTRLTRDGNVRPSTRFMETRQRC